MIKLWAKLQRTCSGIKNIIKQIFLELKSQEPNATLATTAQIGPEGSIENLSGDAGRINIGEHTYIRGRLHIFPHGGEITIGNWCYICIRSEIWSMNSITIGDRVLISHDVNIKDSTAHSLDPVERHAHFRQIMEKGHPKKAEDLPGVRSLPIIIEDDVWISFDVTILKGVRIGKGSIIAAGSIVTHDVPPGVLYYNKINPVIKSLAKEGEHSGFCSQE